MKAIEIYTDMGKFTMAAKHHQTIAEIYETEMAHKDKAIQHFEKAGDYFRGEENNSAANKCSLKVALFSAETADYKKAIAIYEQVATAALARYEQMYPAFQDSRECKLLRALMDHIEGQDVDGFTEAIKDYDSISRLEQWHTALLLRVKKTIEGDELC